MSMVWNQNLILSITESAMDVIGITETSEDINNSFISNVSLDGYKLFHTPSLSRKGGFLHYM